MHLCPLSLCLTVVGAKECSLSFELGASVSEQGGHSQKAPGNGLTVPRSPGQWEAV